MSRGRRHVKDVESAVKFGRTAGLGPPILQVVDRLFGDTIEHGGGDLDHGAILCETA